MNKKTVTINGINITVPLWAKYIAQDPGGEYDAFEIKPLWKYPYGFWKAQGPNYYDGDTVSEGEPYDYICGDDEPEDRIWEVGTVVADG